MNIFNSLGSNYNFREAVNILFTDGRKEYKDQLVKLLEEKYDGKVHLVYKGREALSLALSVLDTRRKKIAINGFTCFAVYEPIEKAGFIPILLDIEKDNLNFSPETFENIAKRENLAAVIIQNTLGDPCDIVKIQKICRKYSILLIEDLAHSAGAVYSNGKEAGTVGDFVTLSFSQDKMIDAVSGGALVIRNKEFIKDVFIKKNQSAKIQDRIYPILTVLIRNLYPYIIGKGLHFLLKKIKVLSAPMDGHITPTAPILWQTKFAKLAFENLDKNLAHRRRIAEIYKNNLNGNLIKNNEHISTSSNIRFPIYVKNRRGLIEYLKRHQFFVSDIWYDAPIAPHRFLSKTQYQEGQCPNAELISKTILNLPTHKNISIKDAEQLVEIINQWEKLQ